MNALMDMTRYLALRIHGYQPGEVGCVGGRVCGDAIRLGDRFTVEYRVVSHGENDELWGELVPVRCIDLTVVRIEAWRREFEEIDRGMRCLMWLDGDLSGIDPEALIGDLHTRWCHDEELARMREREREGSPEA